MRKPFIRSTVFATLLLVSSSLTITSAQQAPWRIVQGSDGTLYLVTSDTRYVVNPDQISDGDLAALTDGGSIGSQLPMPQVAPAQVITLLATPTPQLAPVIPQLATPGPQPTAVPALLTAPPTLTPAPIPTPAPTPKQQPVTLTGTGAKNTSPFSLAPGSYAGAWSGSNPGIQFSLTNFIIELHGVSSDELEVIVNVILKAGETQSGTTNAYNLHGGQYYLEIQAPANWNITLSPQ